MRTSYLFALTAALTACAGAAPGTRPQDMSVEGHDAAAVQWGSASGADAKEQEAARKAAAEHRAAAQSLRDAEAQACKGIAESDRDISPFLHRQDVAGASPIFLSVGSGKSTVRRLTGAKVRFQAVPGLTQEWFQRIVDCHVARNAALGNIVSEMTDCPLVPKGARAVVHSAGAGFDVEITSEAPGAPEDIWARAERLTHTS